MDRQAPTPPDGISERALELWTYYAPLVVNLCRLDRDLLANFCELVARIEELRAEQRELTSARDRWHADVQIRQSMLALKALARELGCSPMSRQSLIPTEPDPDDQLEPWMRR